MSKINQDKAQVLTATVQSYGGLMLSCWVWFPGKEIGAATLAASDARCLYNGSLQNKCQTLFLLPTFFLKNENTLQISFG